MTIRKTTINAEIEKVSFSMKKVNEQAVPTTTLVAKFDCDSSMQSNFDGAKAICQGMMKQKGAFKMAELTIGTKVSLKAIDGENAKIEMTSLVEKGSIYYTDEENLPKIKLIFTFPTRRDTAIWFVEHHTEEVEFVLDAYQSTMFDDDIHIASISGPDPGMKTIKIDFEKKVVLEDVEAKLAAQDASLEVK